MKSEWSRIGSRLLIVLSLFMYAGCTPQPSETDSSSARSTSGANDGSVTKTDQGSGTHSDASSGSETKVDDPSAGSENGADLSTPKAAVETFIQAAVNKDVDLLAQSVHENAAGEFKSLKDKSTDAEMLDELAEMFTDAEVGETTMDGEQAVVAVKLTSRDEELTMAKSDAGWQLVDF